MRTGLVGQQDADHDCEPQPRLIIRKPLLPLVLASTALATTPHRAVSMHRCPESRAGTMSQNPTSVPFSRLNHESLAHGHVNGYRARH